MPAEFKNEPLTDFSKPENRKKMEDALLLVADKLGREYPIIIAGKKISCKSKIISINPANTEEIVGTAQKGSSGHAEDAIAAAWKAFESWKSEPAAKRADIVLKIAAKIRERKFEFSSWLVYEIGKSWAEADAETAEAIDFCEFYAREALRYGAALPCKDWPGEKNELIYIPLGAGAIIPPWNFSFAILAGMTLSAVVAGNTVVLKPASDTPVVAAKFMELAEECGVPPGVINFVTGSGSDVGETLIKHPNIRFISFTGSRDVGLHIVEEAGKTRAGQKWIKRVVAEMGGKDSIIVDSEADIDAAVEAVALSAFGFQGQKCSACSRAIVDEKVYDEFVQKLKIRVEKITVGSTKDPANFMGPVSSKSAYKKILEYIEIGKREGKTLVPGGASFEPGLFIRPVVFTDVNPEAKISKEEIFGPVLAVIKAKNFDDAIKIFNNTDYGLTGGIFTKNRDKMARAKIECFCGNFYVNRKITGAFVAVHPFGGFNMSGTCSKAGGSDYLFLFLQSKTLSERL